MQIQDATARHTCRIPPVLGPGLTEKSSVPLSIGINSHGLKFLCSPRDATMSSISASAA